MGITSGGEWEREEEEREWGVRVREGERGGGVRAAYISIDI